jgi:ParB-like chromosome segregation protein Spo0J
MQYQYHEFANLFPMMEKDDLQGLTESIRASGMKEKITLFEGKILDGRNRSVACEQAGDRRPVKNLVTS